MSFVYKVYPLALWAICLTLWGVCLCMSVFVFRQEWTTLLWPLPVGFLAVLFVGRLVNLYPSIRFIDEREIDGFGYVHQPLDVLVPFWFISLVSSVCLIL